MTVAQDVAAVLTELREVEIFYFYLNTFVGNYSTNLNRANEPWIESSDEAVGFVALGDAVDQALELAITHSFANVGSKSKSKVPMFQLFTKTLQ